MRGRAAARDARRIVAERNHAYTFHADPGFSFGEGWYLAAAAVLAGVAIQIEPDKPQTAQAERFLRDAGLEALFQPYRSRPRANKHLPEIVASAFRADPDAAQRRLRAAFLGDAPISPVVVEWADQRLAVPGSDRVALGPARRAPPDTQHQLPGARRAHTPRAGRGAGAPGGRRRLAGRRGAGGRGRLDTVLEGPGLSRPRHAPRPAAALRAPAARACPGRSGRRHDRRHGRARA